MSTVSLSDGRLLNGIVGNRTGPTLTVQTPTERLVVNRSDVDAIKDSALSLMPDGLLDTLDERELRDLVAYLMSPQQVPMPAGGAEARGGGSDGKSIHSSHALRGNAVWDAPRPRELPLRAKRRRASGTAFPRRAWNECGCRPERNTMTPGIAP